MIDELFTALASAEVGRDQVEEGLDVLARGVEVQLVHTAFVQAPATLLVAEKPHDTVVDGVELRQKIAGGGVFATAGVDAMVHCSLPRVCSPHTLYTQISYLSISVYKKPPGPFGPGDVTLSEVLTTGAHRRRGRQGRRYR